MAKHTKTDIRVRIDAMCLEEMMLREEELANDIAAVLCRRGGARYSRIEVMVIKRDGTLQGVRKQLTVPKERG